VIEGSHTVRTKGVKNGRHRPASGFPYSRLMAATMLASLISALFTLPAMATGGTGPGVSPTNTGPASIPAGTPLSYTVQVTNSDLANPATNVTLTDTVPAGATFLSSVPGGPTCSFSTPTLTCGLGNLAAGTSTTVTINLTAPTSVGSVTNSAVTDSDQNVAPTNQDAMTSVTANADLSVWYWDGTYWFGG